MLCFSCNKIHVLADKVSVQHWPLLAVLLSSAAFADGVFHVQRSEPGLIFGHGDGNGRDKAQSGGHLTGASLSFPKLPDITCSIQAVAIIELVTPDALQKEIRVNRHVLYKDDEARPSHAVRRRILVSEVATQVPPEDFPVLSLYGWFAMQEGAEVFRKCLESVAAGQLWVPRAFLEANFPFHPASAEEKEQTSTGELVFPSLENVLSTREVSAFHMMRRGLSNKEIASELKVTVHTAKKHVHNVMTKMGIRKRRQVVDAPAP